MEPCPNEMTKFKLVLENRNVFYHIFKFHPQEMSSAIFAPISENHDQTIHRVPVNGLIVILRFYG